MSTRKRKPLWCRLGFHQTFGDTILRNYGNDEMPMFFAETYETCDRCGWTNRHIPPVTDDGAES